MGYAVRAELNITPLLNITRLWNGISAVSLMRRSIALALDYSHKRSAFGSLLSEKPLHMDTLAGLQAETEAAFHFAFLVAELTGRAETGEIDEEQTLLLRLLTPLMKLTTGKQVVAVASEALEAFGGAGYVEDTGLPMLLRDAQVLPIWEGTTNVLALDALRALGADDRAFTALKAEVTRCLGSVQDQRLAEPARIVQSALGTLKVGWLMRERQERRRWKRSAPLCAYAGSRDGIGAAVQARAVVTGKRRRRSSDWGGPPVRSFRNRSSHSCGPVTQISRIAGLLS